jgi:hypothetical protein
MAREVTEIPIIFAPSQAFTMTLAEKRADFRVFYTETADRWSFDLDLEGLPVLAGRRIVTGVDLIAPFNLGIGEIVCLDPSGKGAQPTRRNLPDGIVRLYHAWENPNT